MKVNKVFTLDRELADKLKHEDNASALVNKVVWDFYKGSDVKAMTDEQLAQAIAEEKLEKEYKAKLEKLRNG